MEVDFHTLGDEAMLINFDQKINESINTQVQSLNQEIEQSRHPAILYTTPAYCSLTIGFNKEHISYVNLKIFVKSILAKEDQLKLNTRTRHLYIPVCYDRKFGSDLDFVTIQTGLSAAEIVNYHTSTIFKTYMIGFLPGFPYLGSLPDSMFCSRKATPELEVPKGAVAIAGLQTGIYPDKSPGGWQIIGNTPVNLTSSDQHQPFLFQPGDVVQFYSISENKHRLLLKVQEEGNFNWSNIYG